MKITKVINNNTVTAYLNKKEIVLMGAGIGFQKRPGDKVDAGKIEKVYQIRDRFFKKYEQIFKNISPCFFGIAEKIRMKAEKELSCSLSAEVIFGLADHIAFAVERQKNAEKMPNLMLQEIKLLYGKEYRIGEYGRKLVETETGVSLPEDEAGYFALHIVNSRTGEASVDVNNILVLTNGILRIIGEHMTLICQEDDFEYNRFLMHLKFLAKRIFTGEQLQLRIMENMYPELMARDARMKTVIGEIRNFIWESFDYELSDEEAAYLAVHIIRISGL